MSETQPAPATAPRLDGPAGKPLNDRWQSRLLPFIKNMLVFLSVVFILGSSAQLVFLHQKIYFQRESDLVNRVERMLANDASVDKLEAARWITFTQLEVESLSRRYHQANVLLMSRIWIQYLCFIVGIILVIVGAIFILGKFSELESFVGVENSVSGKLVFRSTSPGLFLAFFGTALMIFSLAFHRPIGVMDGDIYIPLEYIPQRSGTKIIPYDSTMMEGAKATRDTNAVRPTPVGH